MATTIQVSDTTKQMLEHLKQEEEANTYDEVIKDLLISRTKTPASMFGKGKGRGWKPIDRVKFHGE